MSGGAWVVVHLCLCARNGWCVAYSSPSLPCPVPSFASDALLACSRSCGSSVGGGLGRSHFPYQVGGGAWLPPCFCPFIPFCFSAASLTACMYSVALHTLLRLQGFVCGSTVRAYLSLPMRACGGGHVLSTTPLRLPSLARLSFFFSRLSGVAWQLKYLYLCWHTHGLSGGVCGSFCAYILLCLRRHVCAYAGGILFAPYVSGRAGVGMFSRLHLLVTFVGVVIVVLFSVA